MLSQLTTRPALTATTAIVAVGMVALIPVVQEMPGNRDTLDQPEVVATDGDVSDEAVAEPAPEAAPEPTPEAPAAKSEPESEAAEELADIVPPPAAESAGPTGLGNGIAWNDGAGAVTGYGNVPSVLQGGNTNATTMGRTTGAIAPAPIPAPDVVTPAPENTENTEEFANEDANPVMAVTEEPVSTFSIDVDTASYSVVRNSLMNGSLPDADAVRIEELINYFDYDYPAPGPDDGPFKPSVTLAETPWNPDTQLMTLALQGELPAVEDRPPLNLVFLIDTSGSMNQPNKLPLLKQSFRLMLGELRPEDQVAIVTYAGSAGLALEPTAAGDRETILAALDTLSAGGSTAGQAGLEQAYSIAEGMTEDGEVSRVLLATDGDFNVGISNPDDLEDFIADKRDSGTYLSVLGFGRGNLQDATMQALAQHGNGTAAYIDTLNEAQKVLVDQLTGALFPIADDVKIQVEFNPAEIAEYRLIGYETRALRREDFNNDKVDAGEIGAGHSVTAIYEITPVGSPAVLNDPLRYGDDTPVAASSDSDELAFLRLRYKEPGEETSTLIERPITAGMAEATQEASWAAAIAGFGQLLRDGTYTGDWDWDDAIALASSATGEDPFGYRREAINLMRLAESLSQ
ncbi:vWA domain-containing protein [Psychromarinibacter sediminicola]